MRILVANRGEIAGRIIRTLDRLGFESIAVWSEPDRGAPHVAMATEAVAIGSAEPALSYQSAQRILAAAERTGADAVHPGYGFLAENAAFADAVERAGLVFVGPTPEQIRLFAVKDTARGLAGAAGLPLLPGSPPLTDAEHALDLAKSVGFPLIVKSLAGGGGIGMHVCEHADDLPDVVERAVRQSAQTFGSPAVMLERYVPRARHVEVQVFGDGEGAVVSLGVRDCSSQRRRQKVVEEAPAPFLAEDTTDALTRAAVELLAPLNYRSAATVEFVLDVDTEEFAFLEVNTRLQVEHGVTEAVTGIDLVEWMVCLAAGDATPIREYRHVPRGHAIEVRLNAENPAKGFVPSAGLVTEVRWPPSVRVDTWVATGSEVTTHYDSLLAKLIVHAPTRDEAFARMRGALDATAIGGVETNRELLQSYLASNVFAGGSFTTTTLEGHAFTADTIDVVAPGSATTVQDHPGRVGYWHVGVPPSGPMDELSFQLGNRVVGNAPGTPGLECTVTGPTLRFNRDAIVCIAGAPMHANVDGAPVPLWEPVALARGSTLHLGAIDGPGLRTYVLVRGGLDVPAYLGSAATFTLGGFGGHGGRALLPGDVLRLGEETPTLEAPQVCPAHARPRLTGNWEMEVVPGPHGAPEFFTPRDIETLHAADWQVHYNSSRTGVRLVGPRPEWARPDGGEAGLHPSNIHDTPYTVGAVDFTGDMPIVLGPDGPSLGGFVCPVTVAAAERWKLGQLAPGDTVRFVVSKSRSRPGAGRRRSESVLDPVIGVDPAHDGIPHVTYRRAGDRAILVEYGPMVLDFDLRLRAHALGKWLEHARRPGVVELTPGIRSIQVQVDGEVETIDSIVDVLRAAERELPSLDEIEVPSRTVHLPLSWDDPATREAIARYERSVRADAPWCPWNIEFIRRINGLATVDDVRRVVYDAEYLVLGLGDVYLGAPVAVPIDPRHRLVTTKYNPARTWTPENAVGIGGAYLCIYGMEGPGGYQFVGRTVPVWNRFGLGPNVSPETPWLLRFFDRIRWFPVDASTLLELRADSWAGRLELEIEDGVFRRHDYRNLVAANHAGIDAFQAQRKAAFEAEWAEWERGGEFSASAAADVEAAITVANRRDASALGVLPEGAVVVEADRSACVWRIDVAEGAFVSAGDALVTVEAMKMESHVVAPVAGLVHQIACTEGQLVTPGAPLVVLVADG